MKEVKGIDGVFIMNNSLLTINPNPGVKVYGERIIEWGGRESGGIPAVQLAAS